MRKKFTSTVDSKPGEHLPIAFHTLSWERQIPESRASSCGKYKDTMGVFAAKRGDGNPCFATGMDQDCLKSGICLIFHMSKIRIFTCFFGLILGELNLDILRWNIPIWHVKLRLWDPNSSRGPMYPHIGQTFCSQKNPPRRYQSWTSTEISKGLRFA